MPDIGKWSPLRIPDAFRSSTDKSADSGDPMNSWDASDWDEPDSGGWLSRITPNHAGQWMILGAALTVFMGLILWLGKFFSVTHQNPWVLAVAYGIAAPILAYVKGREDGFMRNQALDWAFITTGRSVRVLPGKFVERFGNGDIQHIKFTPLKSRVYGAFSFNFLKLGDLEADRENLISKATNTNRKPESEARVLLPGPLTGENTDTVLGRVYGIHGGDVEYHDSGHETDMRVTNPNTLDDDIAADVLSQLQLYDQRIIPELKSVIRTVETQKERAKARAEAERDPEMDRVLSVVDKMSEIIRGNGRRGGGDGTNGDGEVDEINDRAREQVNGGQS